MQDFRNLKVWEKAHKMAFKAFETSKGFPPEELYGLTSQMRRAALSVPTNLAEGCGRGSDADFGRFVKIAMGSASEFEYLVLFSKDWGVMDQAIHDDLQKRVAEVKKMLVKLAKKLK